MPRRLGLAFAAVLIAVAFAAGTLALASGNGSGDPDRKASSAAPAATPATTPVGRSQGRRGHHGRGMARMVGQVVIASLAGRLGVTPEKLQAAGHAVAEDEFAAAAKRAGLTAAQVDALKACHVARTGAKRKAERRAACDRSAVRPALKKLKADLATTDLAAKKDSLAKAAATELGITSDKVLEAVRAELDQRLTQGAALGFVTAEVRRTALACFDTPATCDVKALKAAARKGHGGRHGFGHRR